MRSSLTAFVVFLAASGVSATPVFAQGRACVQTVEEPPPAEEPPPTVDSLVVSLAGFPIKICYQRLPALASGEASWRGIGNTVPVLHSTVLLDIGGVEVVSGSYSLYLTPQSGEWLLRLVRMPDPGFEETAGSVADREVGRTYVPAERTATLSQTLDIVARGSGRHAILFLTWGDMEVTIPVVKQ